MAELFKIANNKLLVNKSKQIPLEIDNIDDLPATDDGNTYLLGTNWYYWNGTMWFDGGVYYSNETKIILGGYSKNGAEYPVIKKLSGNKFSCYVAQFLTVVEKGKTNIDIGTYNNTPTTFEIATNNCLVFDSANKTLNVISLSDYINGDYTLLIYIKNSTFAAGQWLSYYLAPLGNNLMFSKPLPTLKRDYTITSNIKAADQSMCLVNDKLLCFCTLSENGYVNILNYNDLSFVTAIAHDLGHSCVASYNANNDALMVTIQDGEISIIKGISNNIANAQAISKSSGIVLSNLGNSAMVFGETEYIAYIIERVLAVDTPSNYVIKKIVLGMGTNQFENGTYTIAEEDNYNGTYKILKTYIGLYKLPVIQDLKFYDGALYISFGCGTPNVYKIVLDDICNSYIVTDNYSFNQINKDGTSLSYEQEGIVIDNDNLLLSIRETSNITNKYFVKLKK